jgi:hypothetical protein
MGKRTDIITALETRLKTIKTTAGYQTNVGNTVSVWRGNSFNPSELPALNIKYAAEPDQIDSEGLSGPKNVWNRSLPVGITAVVKGGTAIADVEKIIADVWKAIGTDNSFGGKAMYTNPESDTIIEEQEERLITGAIMLMKIEYRTNIYET